MKVNFLFLFFCYLSICAKSQINYIDSDSHEKFIIDFNNDKDENTYQLNGLKSKKELSGFNFTNKLSVRKSNVNDEILWEKEIMQGYNICNALIKVNSKKEIIISGYYQTNITSIGGEKQKILTKGISDLFILKLDSNCNKISYKFFGARDFMSSVWQLEIDENDNVLISGITSDRIDLGLKVIKKYETVMEIEKSCRFIAKLDSELEKGWIKRYKSYEGDGFVINSQSSDDFKNEDYLAFFIDKENNILITGREVVNVVKDDFGGMNKPGKSNVIVDKTSPKGLEIFRKRYQSDFISEGRSIKADEKGYIYVTGFFYGIIDFGDNKILATVPKNSKDSFILKLSKSGDLVWVKDISFPNAYITSYEIEIFNNIILISGRFFNGLRFDGKYLGEDPYKLINKKNINNNNFLLKISTEGNLLECPLDYNFQSNELIVKFDLINDKEIEALILSTDSDELDLNYKKNFKIVKINLE